MHGRKTGRTKSSQLKLIMDKLEALLAIVKAVQPTECEYIGKYVIVRTRSAGVFAGTIKSRIGQEIVLLNARRLWYWAGAASLSQLAVQGVSKPGECKFPCEVTEIWLPETIEIIPATDAARESIFEVPEWKA